MLPLQVVDQVVTLSEKVERLLELLAAIERGSVWLERESHDTPQPFSVTYRASDGSRISVFDDVGEFDYLEWVVFPDGVRLAYDEAPDAMNYRPRAEHARTRWSWWR